MTYRTRLLVAFAYVLVLVIVALAVPLALSTQHRIDREVRAQAADGRNWSPPAHPAGSTSRARSTRSSARWPATSARA